MANSSEDANSPFGRGDRPSDARRSGIYANHLKRPLDVVIVVLLLPIVLPVLLILIALIKLDGGTAFYVQDRIGRAGLPFRCLKLRTMVPDADSRLVTYLCADAAARNEWAFHQKLKNDPRVTPVGRVIRKTSLDELPQLLNVLRGEMSLVGPRPIMPAQVKAYPGSAYFRLRPGITGPWQVSERNHTGFSHRAAYDADYEASLSFPSDVAILARTALVVVKGTGY
jgi:exopolysaccharide production protein ExoY